MRVIVHFGMPKTGSTAIQLTIYNNRRDIRDIYYPDFGAASHNGILKSAFLNASGDFGPDANLLTKRQKRSFSKLRSGLDACGGRDIILSSEALTFFSSSELEALHSVLTDYADQVIAVGYIRKPKAYIESMFQQNIRGGKVRYLNLNEQFPLYQAYFAKFDDVFGRENVHFWEFDSSLFPDGSVVHDFCQRLKIGVSHNSVIRANEGLSSQAVSLLYAYSKYGEELRKRANVKNSFLIKENLRVLKKLRTQCQGNKLRFASDLISPLLETNRTHIAWMEARMGSSLAEDMGKDDEISIHSEAELLTFSAGTLRWLAEQLGIEYVKRLHPRMRPQKVARWMHYLFVKFADQDEMAKRLRKARLSINQK